MNLHLGVSLRNRVKEKIYLFEIHAQCVDFGSLQSITLGTIMIKIDESGQYDSKIIWIASLYEKLGLNESHGETCYKWAVEQVKNFEEFLGE